MDSPSPFDGLKDLFGIFGNIGDFIQSITNALKTARAIALVLFAIILIFAFVCYLFKALGMLKIAKKEGINDIAWFGFIPVISSILLGKMAGYVPGKSKEHSFILFFIVSVFTPGLNVLMALPIFIITCICYYRIFRAFTKNAGGLVLLSIVIPVSVPFIFFSLSRRNFICSTSRAAEKKETEKAPEKAAAPKAAASAPAVEAAPEAEVEVKAEAAEPASQE